VARVLIGQFDAMVGLGLKQILDADGSGVVAMEVPTDALLDRLVETSPDVVVLDLGAAGCAALADQITAQYPAIKVIACSSKRPVMRVYPPFHHGESYLSPLNPSLLLEAVSHRA
jgi:DNA-binding NarL/FixJ family response regulator